MNNRDDHFHKLDKRMAVLEKQMDILRSDLNATLNAFRVDMEKSKTDAEKRDKVNLRWQIGLIASATALIITILGLWLG